MLLLPYYINMDQNTTTENLYPTIISETDTQKMLDTKLNESRVKYMLEKKDIY
jgi:hypothetical protein